MSTFSLSKDKMFHFPHNSALRKEFDFMLKSLNPKKNGQRVYTIMEICEKTMIEQVKENVFQDFHSKSYDIFTKFPPPDMPTFARKNGHKRGKKISKKENTCL